MKWPHKEVCVVLQDFEHTWTWLKSCSRKHELFYDPEHSLEQDFNVSFNLDFFFFFFKTYVDFFLNVGRFVKFNSQHIKQR